MWKDSISSRPRFRAMSSVANDNLAQHLYVTVMSISGSTDDKQKDRHSANSLPKNVSTQSWRLFQQCRFWLRFYMACVHIPMGGFVGVRAAPRNKCARQRWQRQRHRPGHRSCIHFPAAAAAELTSYSIISEHAMRRRLKRINTHWFAVVDNAPFVLIINMRRERAAFNARSRSLSLSLFCVAFPSVCVVMFGLGFPVLIMRRRDPPRARDTNQSKALTPLVISFTFARVRDFCRQARWRLAFVCDFVFVWIGIGNASEIPLTSRMICNVVLVMSGQDWRFDWDWFYIWFSVERPWLSEYIHVTFTKEICIRRRFITVMPERIFVLDVWDRGYVELKVQTKNHIEASIETMQTSQRENVRDRDTRPSSPRENRYADIFVKSIYIVNEADTAADFT